MVREICMKVRNNLYYYFNGLGRREFLNWMPDKWYLSIGYWLKFGKKLNLKNPKTFNEKMQWIKLYDRNPLYVKLVDKYLVKKYVEETLGENYVIKNLGVWDDADKIDFESLPNQFVLKCNHDSGSVIICRDKSKLNIETVKKKLNKTLKHSGYWFGREWPYKDIVPKIIAEEYIEDETDNIGLTDYKFFCFNGVPKLIYVSVGLENHSTAHISFYDMNGRKMPFHRNDFTPIEENLILPSSFEKMKEVAKQLAGAIKAPFVRIDLYPVKGKIYFSEVTFFPCNGTLPFEPKEWDEKLGEWIRLNDNK